MSKITKPEEHFGFRPGADGELARWDKIVEYFYILEKESDRISVTDMGPSTLGNPFLKVVITSPENHADLEDIRRTSMKLADPRGLSEEEIDALVKKGKAVSVQSMSLHATEVGGTQMAINLAYDLVSQDTDEIHNILNNVVFVMVPCFNPDGEIMVTDWYYKTKGTPYEGSNYPSLYHVYTGHDNNRDAFAQNIVESRYMGRILFHEWMPQSYQDHHHMGSYGARIQIAPYKNPVRQYVDPIVQRELNWYGANMAYQMEELGLDGASSGAQYPGWGHYGYHWITNSQYRGHADRVGICKIGNSEIHRPDTAEGRWGYRPARIRGTDQLPQPLARRLVASWGYCRPPVYGSLCPARYDGQK